MRLGRSVCPLADLYNDVLSFTSMLHKNPDEPDPMRCLLAFMCSNCLSFMLFVLPSERCRFWCYPMGQTPCCIHTEQPSWVLTQCAGCHLGEREREGEKKTKAKHDRGHLSQWWTHLLIISRFYTHWWLPPRAGSPLLEPCPTTASLDYPHSLTLNHCQLKQNAH